MQAHKHTTAFLLAATCLAFCLCIPALADIAHPIDGEPIGGAFTLEAGADRATLTDADGKRHAFALMDLGEVEFGRDLVIVRGGDVLLINNDKAQTSNRMVESIKLRAGLHRIVVPYWQGTNALGLSLNVTGPGISGEVALGADLLRCFIRNDDTAEPSLGIDDEGFRLPELSVDEADNDDRFLSRSRYRFYVGDDSMVFENVGVLQNMALKRSGTTTAINTGVITQPNENVGLVFEAFFLAKQDGEYAFALTSDDGSQLYFGEADRFVADAFGQIKTGPTPWLAKLKNGGSVRGELVAIADEQLTLNLALGDETARATVIGLPQTLSLWDTGVQADLVNRDNESTNEDTAYIRDKNDPKQIRSVSGLITGINEEALTFDFRGKERTITRDRVAGLVFAHANRAAPAKAGFHQTFRLRTGQVLPGNVATIDERIALDLIGGGRVEFPRTALISMRSENGRRVDLTRAQPTAVEAIPYFGLTIPHRVNQSFAGEKIRLYDDKTYDRGLAVHSKSRLYYKLDRPCETFRASFGLLNPGGKLGNVTARVLGDGKVLWEQKNITAKTGVVVVEVAMDGVERMILEVDFGEGQDVGDRAAWCNPQLIFAAQQ